LIHKSYGSGGQASLTESHYGTKATDDTINGFWNKILSLRCF